jgi:hypothetical protein
MNIYKYMIRFLGKIWNLWLPIGRFIGDWIARIVLTIFYFTILLPYGLGVRFFADPLDLKKRNNGGWKKRSRDEVTMENARRSG